MTLRDRVLDALSAVYDPELDEPITSLRFVSACEVTPDGDVEVGLRLPTPQCAPNFAYLMAADARATVRRLPGVRRVTVMLEDHYTGAEINDALARGEGFSGAFPGETNDDELTALRTLFQRKALLARQSRLFEGLLARGMTPEELARMRLRDLPAGSETGRCRELRAQLGLSAGDDAPAFVLPTGEPVAAGELSRWLRMARLVRTGLDVNGGICRSLLEFRHGLAAESEEVAT